MNLDADVLPDSRANAILGDRIMFDLAAAESFEGSLTQHCTAAAEGQRQFGRPGLSAGELLDWAFSGLRAANSPALPTDAWVLEGISFGSPLFLEDGADITTQTLIGQVTAGRQLRCFARETHNPGSRWTEHLTVRCGYHRSLDAPKLVDLDMLHGAEDTGRAQAAGKLLAAVEVPAFAARRVLTLWRDAEGGWSRLEVQPLPVGTPRAGALDAGFLSALALAGCGARLPRRIGRLTVYPVEQLAAWSRVIWHDRSASGPLDISLLAWDGQVLAEAKQVWVDEIDATLR